MSKVPRIPMSITFITSDPERRKLLKKNYPNAKATRSRITATGWVPEGPRGKWGKS